MAPKERIEELREKLNEYNRFCLLYTSDAADD